MERLVRYQNQHNNTQDGKALHSQASYLFELDQDAIDRRDQNFAIHNRRTTNHLTLFAIEQVGVSYLAKKQQCTHDLILLPCNSNLISKPIQLFIVVIFDLGTTGTKSWMAISLSSASNSSLLRYPSPASLFNELAKLLFMVIMTPLVGSTLLGPSSSYRLELPSAKE